MRASNPTAHEGGPSRVNSLVVSVRTGPWRAGRGDGADAASGVLALVLVVGVIAFLAGSSFGAGPVCRHTRTHGRPVAVVSRAVAFLVHDRVLAGRAFAERLCLRLRVPSGATDQPGSLAAAAASPDPAQCRVTPPRRPGERSSSCG